MFLRTLIFSLLIAPMTFAADGTAQFDLVSVPVGYNYELNGDAITGDIYGFYDVRGSVEIQATDTGWKGRMGQYRVEVMGMKSEVTADGEKRTRFRIRVLPSGFFTISTRLKPNGAFSLSGSHIWRGTSLSLNGIVSKDGRRFSGGQQYASFGLKREEGGFFMGSTSVQTRGLPRTYSTEFRSSGALDPALLKEEAPELFALLYVLPFSMHR